MLFFACDVHSLVHSATRTTLSWQKRPAKCCNPFIINQMAGHDPNSLRIGLPNADLVLCDAHVGCLRRDISCVRPCALRRYGAGTTLAAALAAAGTHQVTAGTHQVTVTGKYRFQSAQLRGRNMRECQEIPSNRFRCPDITCSMSERMVSVQRTHHT